MRRQSFVAAAAVAVALLLPQALSGQSAAPMPASAQYMLEQAKLQARAEGKSILVEFGASWCPSCRVLDAILASPPVKKVFDAHLVVVRLTLWETAAKARLNNPGATELLRKWGSESVPLMVLVDPNGREIARADRGLDDSHGYRNFMEMLDRLRPPLSSGERAAVLAGLEGGGGSGARAPAKSVGPQAEPAATQVVMLGSGNPVPNPDASGPAVAIVINGAAYVVDAGAGVVRRAAAAARNGTSALFPTNLKIAFVTHLHSDHTLGLPDLIFTPWVMGRTQSMALYGPRGLRSMVENIEQAWEKDIDVRTHHGLGPATGYQAEVHEISPGVIYKDANLVVKAFRVAHGTWDEAFGYRFETADRTIVVAGDTAPTPAIAQACAGCDVLIHEVYSEAGAAGRPADRQKYQRAFHTSTAELAREAVEAKPGVLILYHQAFGAPLASQAELNRMGEGLVAEISRLYSGKIFSARDLEVY